MDKAEGYIVMDEVTDMDAAAFDRMASLRRGDHAPASVEERCTPEARQQGSQAAVESSEVEGGGSTGGGLPLRRAGRCSSPLSYRDAIKKGLSGFVYHPKFRNFLQNPYYKSLNEALKINRPRILT